MEKCPKCGKMLAGAGQSGDKCPTCGKMICTTCGCKSCK